MNKVVIALIFLMILGSCAKPKDGKNGLDGNQGSQGAQGVEGKSVIATPLCPTTPGAYPEVGLLLADGLYAVYYDVNGAHMAKITPGHYVTTDGRNCHFRVESDNTITEE